MGVRSRRWREGVWCGVVVQGGQKLLRTFVD